jgi:hypothetical protein
MRISTLDISGITTTVRRHEALLRYARYLFIFNLVFFLWVAIPQLSQPTSFRGLLELVASPAGNGRPWRSEASARHISFSHTGCGGHTR